MNADGTDQTNITPNSPTGCSPTCYQGHDDDPAWSPDGTKIAYVHGYGPPTNPNAGGGKPNIWVMDTNGGNRTTVSNNPDVSAFKPAWSPNGARIAYVGVVVSGSANIHVMNADGSGQGDPIDSNAATDTNPDWQPVPVCTKRVNAANDPLAGTAGKDVLCGDSRNNTINGAGGNDIVLAQGGNDRLTGALGNDTLNGGPGTDTALYSGTTAVRANLTTQFATGVGSDVLLGIENLSGSSVKDQARRQRRPRRQGRHKRQRQGGRRHGRLGHLPQGRGRYDAQLSLN
jgi:Ca2+-binding RTX toxin-like protein